MKSSGAFFLLRNRNLLVSVLLLLFITPLQAATSDKPNILIIWGDDIGVFNVSACNRGMMDNGAETFTWPDGGTTMFRGEKNTTWEGGFRVPMMVKWPGKIKPGQVSNEIIGMEDWMPTLLAVAGDPDVKKKLLKGHKADGKNFKVHLDGYNFLPYLTGKEEQGPRQAIFYFTDDGQLSALRFNDWKMMFSEQRKHGFDVWQDPFVTLRFPKLMNLRRDPFERAEHEAIGYGLWRAERMYMLAPAAAYVGKFIGTFKKFPPRQKPGSFNLDNVLKSLERPPSGAG